MGRPAFEYAMDRSEFAKSQSWSVPWSDLMMVMFILFVTLFVWATNNKTLPDVFSKHGYKIDLSEGLNQASAPVARSGRVSDITLNELFEAFKQKLSDFDEIRITHDQGRGIVLRLGGESFFDPRGGELAEDAAPALEKVGAALHMTRGRIYVAGYADQWAARGEWRGDAWMLSAKRASEVVNFLTTRMGVEPERVVMQAHAANDPVSPNMNYRRWMNNQRVEIRVSEEYR